MTELPEQESNFDRSDEPMPDAPLTAAQKTAYQILEKNMLLFDEQGDKAFNDLTKLLEWAKKNEYDERLPGAIKTMAKALKDFGDTKERAVECAGKLINYQNAKLNSVTVKKEDTKRYVIVVGTEPKNNKEWLEKVEREQALLPKPKIISNLFGDQTIDELEYNKVNEQ